MGKSHVPTASSCLLAALIGASPVTTATPEAPVGEIEVEAEKDESFSLPALVRGGNAFRVRLPLQLPLLGYRPLLHLELGWLHMISGPHWFSIAGAARLDRSDAATIFGDSCQDACPKGGVYGGELALGYRFAPRFHRKPWLVPEVHGEFVTGGWTYGARLDVAPKYTLDLGVRLGAGLRIFLSDRLGVGADFAVQMDLLIHRPDERAAPDFGLGLALFPAVLELRG